MTPPIITVPQQHETEASVELVPGPVALTYVYARSRDTRNANAPGQDFIAYRWEVGRIAFALCDGVSQSFYGEIAAHYLGLRLIDLLWEFRSDATDSAPLHALLTESLNGAWVAEADALVHGKHITTTLPPMQRTALERKREQGSETMFVAGVVDLEARVLWLAAMGDMRAWLWDANGEALAIDGAQWETRKRWSSRVGMKNGEPFAVRRALDGIAHITVHSDGVGSYAPRLSEMSQDLLNSITAEQAKAPASDDICVFDIDLATQPLFGEYTTLPQVELKKPTAKDRALRWRHVWLATRYRVAVDDGVQPYTIEIDATLRPDEPANVKQRSFGYVVTLPANAEPRPVTCRVQALNDYTFPGAWSAPVTFTPSTAPEALVATGARGSETKLKRKPAKKKRIRALMTILISCILLVIIIVASWIAFAVVNWNELPR